MTLPGLAPLGLDFAVELNWINHGSSSSQATTYDFGDFNAPRPGLMVVGFIGRSDTSGAVSSISIDGGAADLHVAVSGNVVKAAWGWRMVGAGNRNVSVTLDAASGTTPRFGLGVWLLSRVRQNGKLDDNFRTVNTGNQMSSVNLNLLRGGVGLMGCWRNTSTSYTWPNATERADFVVASAATFSFADYLAPSNLSPHSEAVETASTTAIARSFGIAFR